MYKSVLDFCSRVDAKVLNKRTLENLVRAGVFDSIHKNRAQILFHIDMLLGWIQKKQQDQHQVGLFDAIEDDALTSFSWQEVSDWRLSEALAYEKQSLGLYLSGHPFSIYEQEARRLVKQSLKDIKISKDLQSMIGLVTGIRTKMSARGKIAFVTLDDGEMRHDVSVFSETYERLRHKIKEDQMLLIEAKVNQDDFNGGLRIVAEHIYTLSEARHRVAKSCQVTCNQSTNIEALHDYLKAFRAISNQEGIPLNFIYDTKHGSCFLYAEDWFIRLEDDLFYSSDEEIMWL
jgi:DNA polymerase-3 subunit alpha